MKNSVKTLENISTEIAENISLLAFIVRNTPDLGEADNALACLIRSMEGTGEKVRGYIDILASTEVTHE